MIFIATCTGKLPPAGQLANDSLKTKIFPFDLSLLFWTILQKIFKALIKFEEFDIAEKAVPVFSKTLENNVNLSLYLPLKQNGIYPFFKLCQIAE